MRARWIVVFCAAVAAAVPSVALADEPLDRARDHYERGLELFNAGEHALALVELERSYEMAPTYRLLYFIGQAQIRVGAFARALTTLERYLAEGRTDIPEGRRDEVNRDLAGLRARTAYVTVVCNLPGAIVTIHGKEVGKTPLPPRILVEAGVTRISASKAGFEGAAEIVPLAGADDVTIALELAPAPAPAPAPVREARAEPVRERGPDVPLIVAWSTTGVAFVAAAVSGGLALGAVHRIDALRKEPIAGAPADAEAELDRERSAARGWLLATDIFAATALVAGGISLYLTLRPHRSLVVAPRALGADLRLAF